MNCSTNSLPVDVDLWHSSFPEHSKERLTEHYQQAQSALKQRGPRAVALYHADPGLFWSGLSAALNLECKVLVLSDSRPATLERARAEGFALLVDGEFSASEQPFEWNDDADIAFLTSGSTGEPKRVYKSQLQLCAEAHYQCQAYFSGVERVVSTVPHCHIYGFLFRLLAPILAEAQASCVTIQYPEQLIAELEKNERVALITSPAHLKRVHESKASPTLSPALCVSSGGPLLENDAKLASVWLGCPIVEIFGSTETGGVASRSQATGEQAWKLFDGVELKQLESFVEISSAWCPFPYRLDDEVKMLDNQRFKIIGRKDRIAKVNEKRVSLTAMENRLIEIDQIDDAKLLWNEEVGELLALVKTSDQALLARYSESPDRVTKALKADMSDQFERVTLPRRWRVVTEFPLNERGKTDFDSCNLLFQRDKRVPRVLRAHRLSSSEVELTLDISARLPWFKGHFPAQPIFPGVGLTWVVHQLSKQWLGIDLTFAGLSAIKFQTPILPGTQVVMALKWLPEKSALKFSAKASEQLASGTFKFEIES